MNERSKRAAAHGWLRRVGRPKSGSVFTAMLVLVGSAALLWSLVGRLVYASGYAASWDAVDFALALERFDLLAMQPHFPGYPYYILGGMALHRWVNNPAEALAMVNAVAMFTMTVPMYALARRYVRPLVAFLTASVLSTLPYLWVLGTQPMSEGLGVAAALWFVWAVVAAQDQLHARAHLLAAAAFGFLSGVRVSFFPLGAGLVWVWYRDWRKHRSWRRLLLFAVFTCFTQLLWVAVLVLSEGNAGGFLQLAKGFVNGHFNEWGGGIAASPVGPAERLYRFVAENGVWTALWGRSAFIGWMWAAFAAGVLTYLGVAGKRRASGERQVQAPARLRDGTALLLFMAVLYGGWAWVGQNIEKPRHIVPMIMILTLLLVVHWARKVPVPAACAALAALALAQSLAGTFIIREQQAERPAVYQLADYLQEAHAEAQRPFALYTWEETRVLYYLKMPFPHKRIYTFDYFLSEVSALEGQRIFLTNKVLKGFQDQGKQVEGSVVKTAEFHSSGLFDPVYNHITLYEWVGAGR